MNERAVRLAGGGVPWLRGRVLCQFLNGTRGVFTLGAICFCLSSVVPSTFLTECVFALVGAGVKNTHWSSVGGDL